MIDPKILAELMPLASDPPPLRRGTDADRLSWDFFEAVIDLVAEHYRLHRDDVWDVAVELETDLEAMTNRPGLAGVLDSPWGVSATARRIAERLLDFDEIISRPPLLLSIH